MSYHAAQVSAKPLPDGNAQIWFSTRHETHYAFTNVSSHPMNYQQQLYITAEHLFQAMKFLNHQPAIAELVRKSSDPARVARRYPEHYRRDWANQHLFLLETVLLLKFNQYPGLRMELLATGDAQLIQLGSDNFWSQQENGTGQNEFGRVLMRVRSILRGDH
jgi:ribA/ribD-fused uncharacterized protein